MVQAKSNPTTGYSWSVTDNTCGVRFEEISNEYSKINVLLGSGGVTVWTFNSPPESSNYVRGLPCKLTFTYKQPWNTDPEMTVTKEIKVCVN